jgi:hypothetical protein
MPVSEIDAIFSAKSKGKGKAVLQLPAPEPSSVEPSKKKKKKDKKRKRAEQEGDDKPASDAPPATTTPAPVTVIDPSIQLPTAKRARQEKPTDGISSVKKKSKKSTQEDANFADSRGTGPRASNLSLPYQSLLLIQLLQAVRQKRAGPFTKRMNLASVMKEEVC